MDEKMNKRYAFNPDELDWSDTGKVIASNPEEMSMLLFTALYARVRYLDMRPFTEEELFSEIDGLDYNQLAHKALGWLRQLC